MTSESLRLAVISFVYAAISGYGLLLLKQSSMGLNLRFSCGVFLYGIGFLIWLWILKEYPLSIAFPIAAGSLMVATQIFGFSLGEGFTAYKFIGLTLVLIGITLLSRETSTV